MDKGAWQSTAPKDRTILLWSNPAINQIAWAEIAPYDGDDE